MSKIVWGLALAGVAVWSVVAWITYSAVDVVGAGIAGYRTVPGFPPEPFTFAWIAERVHALGLTAVMGGWLVGTVAILSAAWLIQRLFRPVFAAWAPRTRALPERRSWGSSIPSGSFDHRPRPGVLGRLLGR